MGWVIRAGVDEGVGIAAASARRVIDFPRTAVPSMIVIGLGELRISKFVGKRRTVGDVIVVRVKVGRVVKKDASGAGLVVAVHGDSAYESVFIRLHAREAAKRQTRTA